MASLRSGGTRSFCFKLYESNQLLSIFGDVYSRRRVCVKNHVVTSGLTGTRTNRDLICSNARTMFKKVIGHHCVENPGSEFCKTIIVTPLGVSGKVWSELLVCMDLEEQIEVIDRRQLREGGRVHVDQMIGKKESDDRTWFISDTRRLPALNPLRCLAARLET